MSAPPCPSCALKGHQIALMTQSLERQTEACAAISARLAERDHWIAERIAGERKAAGGTAKALDVLTRYGQTDGAHHKTWVIDQAVRALTGDGYAEHVRKACDGEDGPGTYRWDTGIAP